MTVSHNIKNCVRIFATYEHKENGIINTNTVDELTGYALSWLHLTNNQREYPSLILKIANNSGNSIEVWVNPNAVDDAVDYLESLGFMVWDKDDVKNVEIEIYASNRSEWDWIDDAIVTLE